MPGDEELTTEAFLTLFLHIKLHLSAAWSPHGIVRAGEWKCCNNQVWNNIKKQKKNTFNKKKPGHDLPMTFWATQNFGAEAINGFIAMEDQSSKLPKSRNRYLHCTLMNFWLRFSTPQDEGHLDCTDTSQNSASASREPSPQHNHCWVSCALWRCAGSARGMNPLNGASPSVPGRSPWEEQPVLHQKDFFYHFSNRSD